MKEQEKRAKMADTPILGTRKILLDTPARHPALGFDRTAEALAELLVRSSPRFAMGVFGDLGSGKTTLMSTIKYCLREHANIVTVDFNAWRFEREPQLLVPLLDTIRASVIKWSSKQDTATAEQVRRAASRIGRVVRALAAGLSGDIGLPGAVRVSYDVSKAIRILCCSAGCSVARKRLSGDTLTARPARLVVVVR